MKSKLLLLQRLFALAFALQVALFFARVPVPALGVVASIAGILVTMAARAAIGERGSSRGLWWFLIITAGFLVVSSQPVALADSGCYSVLVPQLWCWFPDFGGLIFSVWSCMISWTYVQVGCSGPVPLVIAL